MQGNQTSPWWRGEVRYLPRHQRHGRILAAFLANAFIINPQIRSLGYVIPLSFDSYLKIAMTNSVARRALTLPGLQSEFIFFPMKPSGFTCPGVAACKKGGRDFSRALTFSAWAWSEPGMQRDKTEAGRGSSQRSRCLKIGSWLKHRQSSSCKRTGWPRCGAREGCQVAERFW